MNTYHKIQSLFKRDSTVKGNPIILEKYSMPEFGYLQNCTWQFDEKIDGMNMRLIWKDGVLTYNGKTDRVNIPSNLANCLNAKIPFLTKKLNETFGITDVYLYGEGYGAGIQKGGGYRQDQSFILFDIYCDGWWLRREDVIEIAKSLEIDMVPSKGTGTLLTLVDIVRAGFNSAFGDFKAEGIVARPAVDLMTRNGSRLITKLKWVDFQHPSLIQDNT